MAEVYSITDYIRAKEDNFKTELSRIIKTYIEAQVLSDLPGFIAEFSSMKNKIYQIEEAGRRDLPKMYNELLPPQPYMESINIPRGDYDRLQRLDNAIYN